MRVWGLRLRRPTLVALGLAAALWTPSARADPPRIETPGNAFAPPGDAQAEAIIAYVLGRADNWGWRAAFETGLRLEAHVQPSRATPSLELWTITGHFGSLAVEGELAHVLVDEEDHGRIRVVTHRGALGAVQDSELDDPIQALSVVEGSGLPGSEGGVAARPAVWPGPETSYPGWLVDPPPDLTNGINPTYYVSPELDVINPVRDRARAGTARVFPIDPQTTPETTLVTLGSLEQEAMFLDGLVFRATNCIDPGLGVEMCEPGQVAMADALGDFLYDPPDWVADEGLMGEAFSEVNAYAHADTMSVWLEQHGLSQLTCGRAAQPGRITTNFRRYDDGDVVPGEGGLYTGACESFIVLHQGERDAAWDATIVRHEVGHAAVEASSPDGLAAGQGRSIGYVREAEAINEGVADFLSAASLGWPTIGTYAHPGSARGLDHDLSCPRDLVGEPHADGMIISAALWDAYQQLGEPFTIALLDSLTLMAADATWAELVAVLRVVVAREIGEFAVPIVLSAFSDRGASGCSRVVSWDDLASGTSKAGYAPASVLVEAAGDSRETVTPYRPGPLQIRIDPPEGAVEVDLSFIVEGIDAAQLSVFARFGEEVEFSFMSAGPGVSTVEAAYNESFSGNESVSLTARRGPIYLALGNHAAGWPSGGDALVRLGSLEYIYADEGETSGGSDGEDGDGSDGGADEGLSPTAGDEGDEFGALDDSVGCACSAGPSHQSPGPAWLLVLLLGFARRRRA